MGWKKWFKKVTKKVTKPVSKVFKGVAKGIAKVGKAVMRGVAKLNKKLGPLGMIAMSIAMPYALSGLSSMVGQAAMSGYHPATGMMGSKFTFIRAVGNVGNQIRTGYQAMGTMAGKVTGKIGETLSTMGNSITNTITKVGQKFGGNASGDNFWTRISKGFKRLFNAAKEVTPKIKKGTEGSVDVFGVGPNVHGEGSAQIWSSMKSSEAGKLIQSAERLGLDTPLLRGQSIGSQQGWITKPGGSKWDELVTETINKASQDTVNVLNKDSLKYFNDLKGTGQFDNNQEILDAMFENKGVTKNYYTDFSTSPDAISTKLSQTGDYKLTNPNEPTSYTFTGEKTFDNPVSERFKVKEKIKKLANNKKFTGILKDTLFKPMKFIQPEEYEFVATSAAESNENVGGALSATDVKGSEGSSSYANVFGTKAWEQLKNYHRNMNYQGSMDYYG